MKISKKFLALLLILTMTFALTACSGIVLDLGNGYQIVIGNPSSSQKNDDSPSDSESNGGSDTNSATSSDTKGEDSSSKNSSSSSKNSNSSGNNSSNDSKSSVGNSSDEPESSTSQPTGSVDSALKPIAYQGLSEAITVTWDDTKVSSAKAYYKLSSASSYTQVDAPLVRSGGSNVGRVDIVGLKKGNYDVRIDVGSESSDIEIKNISVSAYDRSGYAHFGNSNGVGAYNNDGTLKSGVKVVYITEATKNSENGGIVASLKKSNTCVRIIGRVANDTMKSASSWEGKYTKITGLISPKYDSKEGTTWGMAELSGVSNLTVEGIGDDAELYQWGITFKRCNSIEVRNLTFTDYPEDACAFEGDTSSPTSYKYFWVHNNLFNKGNRLFDDSAEGDKAEGDGAIDLKGVSNLTYSYNKIQNCHKTGLVGGSDTHLQCNITYHHNYFYKNSSRMPLGRQANMHYYNNYFQGCGTVYDLRSKAYVFSEANTFESCSNPCKLSSAACKSFGDSGIKTATVVTDRTKTVSNSCSFGSSFDTDSSKFYYDSTAKVSKVSYLTNAATAKKDCVSNAGPWKANLGV
ncbi:MAG: hypothetical protein ACI4M6_07200 [Christensenellaceae bacterium]